jgi:hypothetical protein
MTAAARWWIGAQTVGVLTIIVGGVAAGDLGLFLFALVGFLSVTVFNLDLALLRNGRMIDRADKQLDELVSMVGDMAKSAMFAVRCHRCGTTAILVGIESVKKGPGVNDGPALIIDGPDIAMPPGWGVLDGTSLCRDCLVMMS